MRVAVLFLLLSLACLAESSTAEYEGFNSSTQSFSDWLQSLGSTAGAAAAKTSSESAYAQLETDHACFKIERTCGGANIAENPFTYWSSLQCCRPERHYGRDGADGADFLSDTFGGLQVGSCFMDWTGAAFPALYVFTTNVVVASNFEITCTLNAEADTCGPTGCGDITISAQGPSYILLNAITETEPTVPPTDCPAIPGGRQAAPSPLEALQKKIDLTSAVRDAMRMPRPATRTNNTTAKAAAAPSLRHHAPSEAELDGSTVVWQTQVLVHSGPMTVFSRKHQLKWTQGWFELSVPWTIVQAGSEITLDEVAALEAAQGYKLPRVAAGDFYKYNLDFHRQPEQQQYGKYSGGDSR